MVNSISSNNLAGRGAYSLMQQLSTDSGDLFSTLAGTNGGGSSQALFGALAGNGGTPKSIDSILQQQKVDLAKNNIYNNAAQRLAAIQGGNYTPTDEWEKIAGYAMAKGKPVVISLDSSGQVQAQLQSESSLSKFNPQLQEQILQLDSDTELMAQKIQANATNDGWVKKLAGASNDLYQVYNNVIVAQTSTTNNWEQQGVLYMQTKRPFKIQLDTKGDLMVQDQATDPELAKLPYNLQKTLRAAIASIPTTLSNGTATKDWEFQAQNFAAAGVPYYLDIDASTGVISAKENSAANITPAFLKSAPYPDVGDSSPALKDAAEYIKAGKAFFFDIDSTGTIGAKEATVHNIVQYNAVKTDATSTYGAGSILSLFA
ncbi:MAG: hypothetical protein EPN20_11185 [Magnetospirillum sp.]|nr:MAG: hypothetical protein EPN20_11185 [Magnetospirillum sp.]